MDNILIDKVDVITLIVRNRGSFSCLEYFRVKRLPHYLLCLPRVARAYHLEAKQALFQLAGNLVVGSLSRTRLTAFNPFGTWF